MKKISIIILIMILAINTISVNAKEDKEKEKNEKVVDEKDNKKNEKYPFETVEELLNSGYTIDEEPVGTTSESISKIKEEAMEVKELLGISTSLDAEVSMAALTIQNNQLAINNLKISKPVYSTASSANRIGYIDKREIVKILSTSGSYYKISYLSGTTTKVGYVTMDGMYSPSQYYVPFHMPVESGYRTHDYMQYDFPSEELYTHMGIDIGGVGTSTSVYSVYDGKASFYTYHKNVNNVDYISSFGNCVIVEVANLDFIYGHLSKFITGVNPLNYATPTTPMSGGVRTLITTKTVKTGDKIGVTGNTGNSYGEHLHFEVYLGTTLKDPFQYVLFPGCDYLR